MMGLWDAPCPAADDAQVVQPHLFLSNTSVTVYRSARVMFTVQQSGDVKTLNFARPTSYTHFLLLPKRQNQNDN